MSFPPGAYLIGAQKAGTTTLAYLMDQHARVTVAQPKEPHFFTHNWSKGLSWYRSQFPGPETAVYLDASTSYSMAPLTESRRSDKDQEYAGVPARVFSTNPDARFIYIMRDPVERTYSGYWHNVRVEGERRAFRDALLNDPFYLDVGDYHGQLLAWLEYFPLRSFSFVLFEDMKRAPERTALECCGFLGLENEGIPLRLDSAKNRSYQVGWVGRKVNEVAAAYPGLRSAAKPFIRGKARRLLDSVKSGNKPMPDMDEEDRRYLIDYFRERNDALERLTGLSLQVWQG